MIDDPTGHEFDDIELVLRVIHTIHQAMMHHRSYPIPLHRRKPVPTAKVDPGPCSLPGAGFAGKARRGRRAASTERSCALVLDIGG